MRISYLLCCIYLLFWGHALLGASLVVEQYDIACALTTTHQLKVEKYILLKVLTPERRDRSVFTIGYDKSQPIKKLSIKILDEHKNTVRSVPKKEIEDNSNLSQYFYIEGRKKVIEEVHNEYPYYLEVSYTQTLNEYIDFPRWSPQMGKNVPSRSSSYSITVPNACKIRKRFYNFEPKHTSIINSETTTYKWTSTHVPSFNLNEAFGPNFSSVYPHAYFGPMSIEMGNVQGSLKTWKSFGCFISNLNTNLDVLPLGQQRKIHSMVKDATTVMEQIEILYKYLQENTRYVNITIGIGGWKPYSAAYVDENKYGDCKALSIYMKALLKAVGIESYYALINAGYAKADLDTSFIGNQFNHAVLCVPLKNDSLWLDCTSSNNPCGYWGTFTENRHALICNGLKSELLATPKLNHNSNYEKISGRVTVKGATLHANINRELGGDLYEDVSNLIEDLSEEEILKEIKDELPYSNVSISAIKHTTSPTRTGAIKEFSELSFKNHIITYGNNVIIKQIHHVLSLHGHLEKERETDIYIPYDQYGSDSILYTIPDGYRLITEPENYSLTSQYGIFEQNTTTTPEGIVIAKSLSWNAGTYNQDQQLDFFEFISEVKKHDKQKFLLQKSQ